MTGSYCATPADECHTIADCAKRAPNTVCSYDVGRARWVCVPSICHAVP